MLLAQLNYLQLVFFLAMALTIWILLIQTQRYFSRRRAETAQQLQVQIKRRPLEHRAGAPPDGPEEAFRWEVRMHETARELSALLDSKLSVLQALVAEADRAAARLEAALDRAGVGQSLPPGTRRAANQAEALQAIRPAEPQSSPLPQASHSLDEDSAERSAQQRRREEVYTLADYGYEASEIAQRLQLPVGEVQLMLNLRQKR
jgi:hypothetical protein